MIKALRLGALRYWDCSDPLWETIRENNKLTKLCQRQGLTDSRE